jgi:hypothetical protein
MKYGFVLLKRIAPSFFSSLVASSCLSFVDADDRCVKVGMSKAEAIQGVGQEE